MDILPRIPDATTTSPPTENQHPSGQHFVTWLYQGIRSHHLIINDAKALIHTVDDTLFLVTPSIFQRYTQEYPDTAHLAKQDNLQDWQWLQKQFEQQRLHRKQPNGLNIWTCQVTGPRKSRRLHGYLLKYPGDLVGEIALNNPYLQLLVTPETEQHA
jgi:hypothetical protein